MKTEKVIWGLVLVSAGIIALLDNVGLIDFRWGSLWHYWPVFLILAGINMVFARNSSRTGGIVAIVSTTVVLGFLVFAGLTYPGDENRWHFNGDRVGREHRPTEYNFIEAFTAGTRRAELNISGGATSYKIEETTSDLIDARVKQVEGRYSLKKTSRDSVEVLNFSMNERHGEWDMDEDNNEVKLKLNSTPLWDINVKIGAGETDFDLTHFKVQNLTFGGGAASFRAKLGEPESLTNVSVKSGVSDINISVPESVGCQIIIRSGLSSEDFNGFTKQADGTYVTSNFSSSPKKIIINLNGGLSNFEVNRY